MKRVLASAGIFTAIMAASTGMATAGADSAPGSLGQTGVARIADPSSGSSDLLGNLLHALSTGSAAECTVILDGCVPV
ncbi:hypothetical protein ACFVAV_28525 [Nocardia sp. NPDC057663]|uniref:hypothetical protein n=1 Tax=Nocardia sp. NPDC057663 TaxID=3346201 RepID=UPI00366F2AEA